MNPKEILTMKKIVSAVLVCVLLVGCVFALASCAPSNNPNKALACLEAEGYKVVLIDYEHLLPDDVEASLTAFKDGKLVLTITYYEEASDAKDAWDEISKADREAYLESNKDCVYARSGKMIYFGTKEAANAAR